MHLKRWVTGIIGAWLLVVLLFIGIRWIFYLFLFTASIISLREFFNITTKGMSGLIIFLSYLLTFALFLIITIKQIFLLPVLFFLFAAIPLTFHMLTYGASDKKGNKEELEKAVIGPVYICLPIAMLILVDMHPKGNLWVFFLLAVIFANDTGAFYAGKLFGRHKLYKDVSPNKTWEGAVGGLLFGLIIAVILLNIGIFKIHALNIEIILLVIGLSVAAQLGDLVESMIKRSYGVKDSGGILPGHGGLLDRIDGLFFAVPVLYVYMAFV